jgi:hypothetical protein
MAMSSDGTIRERTMEQRDTQLGQIGTQAQTPADAIEQPRVVVLLPPEREGDVEALLRALLAIAVRVAYRRRAVVECAEAGELIA